MAQSWEIERAPGFIPLTELRNESVVKKLIEENRTPILALPEGVLEPKEVTLFVPPSQSQYVSIVDAREIKTIMDKLRREI